MVSCYAFGAMFVLDLLTYAYTQKLRYKSDMYVVLVRMHPLLRLCFAPLHAYAHIHRSPPVKICYLRRGDPQEALAQIRRIVEQSLVMGGTLQGLRHVLDP